MSEQTPDRALRPPHLALATALRGMRMRWELRSAFAWGAAGAVTLAIGLYFWLAEGHLADTVFATAVTLAVGATIVCVGRRVLVASVLIVAMVGIARAISYAKQQATEVLLHAYDLVTLLRSWSALTEVWSEHRNLVLGLAFAVFATTVVCLMAARSDATRVPRLYAVYALSVFAGIAWMADTLRGQRRHTEFYFENTYVTFFYSSWFETVQALWRGRLIEAAQPRPIESQHPRLEVPAGCTPATKLPHIVLVHQESVVPPALFPTLSYDRSLDPFFRSLDGKLNKLRVETFGGASWLTEFSLLTGLSTQSFGGMRQFLQQVMAGGIHDTLPQALARCGYRNVMFYPMLRHFLGSGRFFEATGIREIFDAKAQGAKLANERDRFYYANALAEIGRHIKASAQPLFLYIQTMAAHGPYDYAYSPKVAVAGGGAGTSPEASEYLRRLAMARMDYGFLRSELVRRFPGHAFLIMHYGDHQPTATLSLLGFDENASIEDVMGSGNEAARTTYYVLDGVRYRPPPLPSLDMLHVAYLGTVLLEAAGVPFSDSYRERWRLMTLCKGRYDDCPAREEVLRFHRRLIDSGLMKAL
ncbi:MAG: sulfatase-like hydrolase/transferase [Rhodospirillales bacterium]|nr:sulfatase-like hydrolase/transferase [Rhodospirillales bacterium]